MINDPLISFRMMGPPTIVKPAADSDHRMWPVPPPRNFTRLAAPGLDVSGAAQTASPEGYFQATV